MKLKLSAIAALFVAFGTIFFYAPVEAQQGIVQKIFYVHVACAMTMYVGFATAFVSSLLYLADRREKYDEIAVSGAEVGFFFCTIVLSTGLVWAKPIWGAWWTWDPRLTTTLLVWLLYASYLVLRGYLRDSPRKGTVSAIVAIIAALDIPLLHFSVRIWRGMHPTVVSGQGGGISPAMKLTLLVTLGAMLLLFAALFSLRLRLERSRNHLARIQLERQEV
ncbi:MAG: cytochrome c biogenesis protein CcsA [Pseudomonadota bacterium]